MVYDWVVGEMVPEFVILSFSATVLASHITWRRRKSCGSVLLRQRSHHAIRSALLLLIPQFQKLICLLQSPRRFFVCTERTRLLGEWGELQLEEHGAVISWLGGEPVPTTLLYVKEYILVSLQNLWEARREDGNEPETACSISQEGCCTLALALTRPLPS